MAIVRENIDTPTTTRPLLGLTVHLYLVTTSGVKVKEAYHLGHTILGPDRAHVDQYGEWSYELAANSEIESPLGVVTQWCREVRHRSRAGAMVKSKVQFTVPTGDGPHWLGELVDTDAPV